MEGWLKGGLWGLGIGIILAIVSFFVGDWPGYFILMLLFPVVLMTAIGAFIGSWIDFFRKKPVKTNSTGYGIAGFILGLLSIVLFSSQLGSWLGIIGLASSIIQIKRNKTKLAVAGLILSIIGIILSILVFIVGMIVINNLKNSFLGG